MISTATTESNRGTTLGLLEGPSAVLADGRMPVAMPRAASRAGTTPAWIAVEHRITAELRASDLEGQVCFRPAATDVLAPTTGHPAWSPPT